MQTIIKVVLLLLLTTKEIFAVENEYNNVNLLFVPIIIIFILIIVYLTYKIIMLVKRKNELEELLNNQRKFDNTLLDTIPHPIYYKNINGEYLGCNEAFSKLVGVRKDGIVGKKAIDFFPTEWTQESSMADTYLVNYGGTRVSEKTFRKSDGGVIQFLITKSTFENIDKTLGGIVGVMDDVTERTYQRQYLIQQSKLVEMGDMIAAIAHQWNEPLVELSAIVQDLEFSFKNETLDKEEVDTFVKDAMSQIQYMSKTLKDFRNFLKPSTKKTLFYINDLLDKLLDIIKRQISYAYIKLNINYHPKFAHISVYGYENEFMQVLLNIINNAKSKIIEKFQDVEDKKGEINIDIWQEYDTTFINISDNAGGVRSDVLKRMFDPYFTTKKDGTGIGLYMAKVIVEDKMGGKISATAHIDSVVFKIEVPSGSTKVDLE